MNSVFIGKRPVATTGTDHAAVSEEDMIIVGGKPPAIDYVNDARSKDVVSAAGKTYIHGCKIWTEESVIPTSKAAPEAPPGVGQKSGTWRLQTKAISTCSTVFVEGQKVIRLDDPTVQNSTNCAGVVMTGADADAIVARRNARGSNAAASGSAKPPKAPMNQRGTGQNSSSNGKDNKASAPGLTWIELQFVPNPPMPLPRAAPPLCAYTCTLKDPIVASARPQNLDLDKGSTIRWEEIPSGKKCTIEIEFPIDWPVTSSASRPIRFEGLDAGRVHVFDIMNEVPAVAQYMADQMNVNVGDPRTREIKALNDEAHRLMNNPEWYEILVPASLAARVSALKTAAYSKWAYLVGPGQEWDHKEEFRGRRTRGPQPAPGYWHTWGSWEYFLDPWSNIHFGYVGRAAEFSTEELLLGANIAQYGHNLLRDIMNGNFRSPEGDTSEDKAAIRAGCKMFDDGLNRISAESLRNILEGTPEFKRRAHSYESATRFKSIRKKP